MNEIEMLLYLLDIAEKFCNTHKDCKTCPNGESNKGNCKAAKWREIEKHLGLG